jgi:hypothetical protein
MSDPSARPSDNGPPVRPPSLTALDEYGDPPRLTVGYHPASGQCRLLQADGTDLTSASSFEKLLPLIRELDARGGWRAALDFGIWCAENAVSLHSATTPFLAAAKQLLVDEAARATVKELREKHAHVTFAAATIGLKIGDASAASYLGAFACLSKEPRQAALAGAQMYLVGCVLFARKKALKATPQLPVTDEAEVLAIATLEAELVRRLSALPPEAPSPDQITPP